MPNIYDFSEEDLAKTMKEFLVNKASYGVTSDLYYSVLGVEERFKHDSCELKQELVKDHGFISVDEFKEIYVLCVLSSKWVVSPRTIKENMKQITNINIPTGGNLKDWLMLFNVEHLLHVVI